MEASSNSVRALSQAEKWFLLAWKTTESSGTSPSNCKNERMPEAREIGVPSGCLKMKSPNPK